MTLTLLAAAALAAPFANDTLPGETVAMGKGSLACWAEVDAQKNPVRIGITLKGVKVSDLPNVPYNGAAVPFTVDLPKGLKDTPFTDVSVDFMTNGHEPQPVYGVPHYDLHFYLEPEAVRQKWTIASDEDKKVFSQPVPDGYMPADYVMAPGTEIPMMGSHWVDVKAPELNGQPFTTTMIYGTYDGRVVFLEPMVAMSFIEEGKDFEGSVPLPEKVSKKGWYPTKWWMDVDSASDLVSFSIGAFVKK
jgi:hypothetical protein